jgi:hypothetical protein
MDEDIHEAWMKRMVGWLGCRGASAHQYRPFLAKPEDIVYQMVR